MVSKAKAKKNVAVKKPEQSPYSPSQIKKFVGEVKVEFGKIVWPPRKATLGLTGIVIILSTVIAVYLGTVDMMLGKLVASLLH